MILTHARYGIGMSDNPPPFRFALTNHNEIVRTFEPHISTLMSDREAWEALFDDDFRIASHRKLCGNKAKRTQAQVVRCGKWPTVIPTRQGEP